MNVRKYATDAIEKILDNGGYSNIVVNETLKKFLLSEEDKSLFTKIVYGTIENLLLLEFYLDPFLKRKPKKFIKYLLYNSIYQIIYLNIPDYAVVNEAVNLARLKSNESASFVNGVLRAFLRTPRRELEEVKYDEITYLSYKYSTPAWLVAYFLKDYPLNTVKDILSASVQEKLDCIRVNTLKTNIDYVKDELTKLNIPFTVVDKISNCLVVYKSVVNTKLFSEGLITIQDISSQLVSVITNPAKNSYILDLCSAPGGKAAHLASLVENTGKIFCCDIHKHKITLMEKNFKRLGVTNCFPQLVDATKINKYTKTNSFVYVVADVPCSGLGVINHKVDLKYKITKEGIDNIIAIQKDILNSNKDLVKVNGYLIYSTCTINKDENENQIKEFINNNPQFKIIEEIQILQTDVISNGISGDGFYICKLQRYE